MARASIVILAIAVFAGATRADIVDIVQPGNKTSAGIFRNTIGSATSKTAGSFRTSMANFTTRFDTTATTAQLIAANYELSAPLPFSDSETFVIGPPVFPNPAPTATWHVSVNFDPIPNAPPNFVSSSVGMLNPYFADRYLFRSTLMVEAPDSLAFSGIYRVVGPTTTVETPFSMTFQRIAPSDEFAFRKDFVVRTGANFPSTTKIEGAGGPDSSVVEYAPNELVLFDQIVDGTRIHAEWTTARLYLYPSPEPSSFAISVAGLLPLLMTVRSLASQTRRRS